MDTNNNMPVMPQAQMGGDKKVGPIIGVIIIVIILIAAAFYFFMNKSGNQAPQQQTSSEQATNHTLEASATASADDVSTLQSDLDSNLKDVDYSF